MCCSPNNILNNFGKTRYTKWSVPLSISFWGNENTIFGASFDTKTNPGTARYWRTEAAALKGHPFQTAVFPIGYCTIVMKGIWGALWSNQYEWPDNEPHHLTPSIHIEMHANIHNYIAIKDSYAANKWPLERERWVSMSELPAIVDRADATRSD